MAFMAWIQHINQVATLQLCPTVNSRRLPNSGHTYWTNSMGVILSITRYHAPLPHSPPHLLWSHDHFFQLRHRLHSHSHALVRFVLSHHHYARHTLSLSYLP